MSVKIMSLVWESGRYEGGTLLVLLALADWADDEGQCWPGITKLSAKARLERRQTQNVLRRLEADGIVVTAFNTGRGNQNRYQIRVQNLRPLEKAQSTTQRAQSVTKNVQPTAPDPLVPDPSVNTHTTAGAASASPQDPGEGNEPVTEQTSFPTVPSDGSGNPSALAAVTMPAGFSVPASARIAASVRKGKFRAPVKPAGPPMFPVPPNFYDTLTPVEKRDELAKGLNFDRGEFAKRVEAWEIDRREKRLEFMSRDSMKANLRKYLLNCDVNKNSQRRAS